MSCWVAPLLAPGSHPAALASLMVKLQPGAGCGEHAARQAARPCRRQRSRATGTPPPSPPRAHGAARACWAKVGVRRAMRARGTRSSAIRVQSAQNDTYLQIMYFGDRDFQSHAAGRSVRRHGQRGRHDPGRPELNSQDDWPRWTELRSWCPRQCSGPWGCPARPQRWSMRKGWSSAGRRPLSDWPATRPRRPSANRPRTCCVPPGMRRRHRRSRRGAVPGVAGPVLRRSATATAARSI